jgi:Rrf2 family protein
MILSRTSQYAIQALIFVATQPRGVPVLIRTVSERLGVPLPYLAKIMQNLGRGGLIHSFRGRQGGVCLGEGGETTDLMSILTLIDGPGLTESCVLGLKACSDATACPMHKQWKPIKTGIVKLLNEQTLGILAAAVRRGRYRLTELPLAALESTAVEGGVDRAAIGAGALRTAPLNTRSRPRARNPEDAAAKGKARSAGVKRRARS